VPGAGYPIKNLWAVRSGPSAIDDYVASAATVWLPMRNIHAHPPDGVAAPGSDSLILNPYVPATGLANDSATDAPAV
jgi:hypothetical protein